MEFKQDIQYWNTLLDIATVTEKFIRKKGIHNNGDLALEKRLNEKSDLQHLTHQSAQQFKQEVIQFVKDESQKAKPEERLLGSSEIIESIFGKQKFIEKEQSKSGFTSLLLTLGAIISTTTTAVVKQALEVTSTKMVRDWYEKNIKKSLQAKRIEAFSKPGNTEQKQNQLLAT